MSHETTSDNVPPRQLPKKDTHPPTMAAMIVPPQWRLPTLNLVSFTVNCLLTYLSLTGLFGETNTALSAKYQTLVTPIGWAFSIWGPIFIWEGVFAIAGIAVPSLRTSILQEKIGLWWTGVCIMQIGWSIAFAQDQVLLSLFFMLSILLFLIVLCYRVYSTTGTSTMEFLTLKGPFFLQLGWITAASFVNINVVADARIPTLVNGTVTGGTAMMNPLYFSATNSSTLLALGVLSLAGLFLTGVLVGILPDRTDGNVIVCGVVAWALGGVAAQLNAPMAKTAIMFGDVITNALSTAAATLSLCMVALVVVLLGRRAYISTRARFDPTSAEAKGSQRDLSAKLEEGGVPVRA